MSRMPKSLRHCLSVAALIIVAFGLFLFTKPSSGQQNRNPSLRPPPPPPPASETEDTRTEQERIFRIGYAHTDPTDPLNDTWFRGLQRSLNENEAFRSILMQNGFTKVSVSAAEGNRDLVQRMDVGEFDLVFCPAIVFVRHLEEFEELSQIGAATTPAQSDAGNYQAIFQIRRGEFWSSRADGNVLLQGCIITGPHSDLFDADLTPAAVRLHLQNEPVAFVSSYSAAGYLYPLLLMHHKYETRPTTYYFYGSSEAVIKAVASGLVDVGVCEVSAIESLFAKTAGVDNPEQYIRIVEKTKPNAPSDPIVIRRSLAISEDEEKRQLITGLERALRQYFSEEGPVDFDIKPGRNSYYEALRRDVEYLDSLGEK